MPTPTTQAAFEARPDLLAAYSESDLVGQSAGLRVTSVLTPLVVGEQAGTQPVIKRESLLSVPTTLRAETAAYPEDTFEYESRNFATKEYGLRDKVPERQKNRYASWFDLEMFSAARVMHRWKLAREVDGINVLTDSSVYTGSLTSAMNATMDVVATATPVAKIMAACNAIFDATGEWPNTVALSRRTFREARMTDEFREFLSSKGAGNPDDPGSVTAEVMANVLDIERVEVFGSAKNSANPGQAGSIGSVFPDTKIVVARVARTSDPMEACVGRMLFWPGDGAEVDGLLETKFDDDLRIHESRCRGEYQFLNFTAELGHVITGC